MALGLSAGVQEICLGLLETCTFLHQLNIVLDAGKALKQGRGSEKVSAKTNSTGFFSFVVIMQRERMSTAGSSECLLYEQGNVLLCKALGIGMKLVLGNWKESLVQLSLFF